MQNPEPHGFHKILSGLTASSPVAASNLLPGVVLAAFPYVERRQMTGVVILAAKSLQFALTEEIQNICNRLGLDSATLNQLAQELPGFAEDVVQRQDQMLVSMVRDQLKLAGLDHELASL